MQVFDFFVQWIDFGSKKPLQLTHSGYQDTKIWGTKVRDGSLDFNVGRSAVQDEELNFIAQSIHGSISQAPLLFCMQLCCFPCDQTCKMSQTSRTSETLHTFHSEILVSLNLTRIKCCPLDWSTTIH